MRERGARGGFTRAVASGRRRGREDVGGERRGGRRRSVR